MSFKRLALCKLSSQKVKLRDERLTNLTRNVRS